MDDLDARRIAAAQRKARALDRLTPAPIVGSVVLDALDHAHRLAADTLDAARVSNAGWEKTIAVVRLFEEAVDKVLALHEGSPEGHCWHCHDGYGDPVEYPCETRRILTDSLAAAAARVNPLHQETP